MVSTIFRLAGFEVEHTGSYPGWKPEPTSEIVRKAQAVHLEVLGKTPELVAMHAGLECGVIGRKASGNADDFVWAAYRGCAQSQRAAEDLFGGAVLGVPEGAAGAVVIA
jgi:hypothetical protein